MSFVRLFEKSDNSVSIPTWEQGVNFRCPVFTFKTVFICFTSHNIIEEMTLLCLFWITTIYYFVLLVVPLRLFLKHWFFGAEEHYFAHRSNLRRCHESRESSIFRKISWKIRVTLFSEVQASHVHDQPLTSRRRPKKNKRRRPTTHQPWRHQRRLSHNNQPEIAVAPA